MQLVAPRRCGPLAAAHNSRLVNLH
jgi:hypothetical protein